MARDDPSYRLVFDVPFQHYIMWCYPFKQSNWGDGLSTAEYQAEYQEVYELTQYFLTQYNGTGKNF